MSKLNNTGFTLIEIMIGMALLSSAMVVATMAYTSISRLQQKGVTVRTVQQNGRYVMEGIARDVRSSAIIQSPTPGAVNSSITLLNSQDIGGSETYQYDSTKHKLFRCLSVTGACGSSNGTDVGGDNISITRADFEYHAGSGVKPFVKISLKITQQDTTLTSVIPSVNAYSYDLSTVVASRELQ